MRKKGFNKRKRKSKKTLNWSEVKKTTRKEVATDGFGKLEFIVNKFDEKEWTW